MFQFQCPQCANVLQADATQGGQQSQCPICRALFIIPAPAVGPGLPLPGSFPAGPAVSGPPAPSPWLPPGPVGGIATSPPVPPASTTNVAIDISVGGAPRPSPPVPLELQEPEILHIPCPQCRQVLEAPVEMLDQEVLCPHCEAQFRLLRRDSIEFQRRRQQELEIRERKAGRFWFNWAIVAVVLVVMFLLFLIFSASGGEPHALATGARG